VSNLKLTGRRSLIGNRQCYEVAATTGGESQESLWVDPARDFTVARIESIRGRTILWKIDVLYTPNGDTGWVPQSWALSNYWNQDGTLLYTAKATITRADLNPAMTAEEFDISFPAGAVVADDT